MLASAAPASNLTDPISTPTEIAPVTFEYPSVPMFSLPPFPEFILPLDPSVDPPEGKIFGPPKVVLRREDPHVNKRQGGIKVLVVGDSISQGIEGDFTWRYRLLQWFNSQGVAVQFVGPYIGTVSPDPGSLPTPPKLPGEVTVNPPARTDGGYGAGVPAFSSNHFAVWGRQAAQDMSLIRAQVQAYAPDYLLVELGFNDIGWFISDAPGTLNSMKSLVDEARAAKPNLKSVPNPSVPIPPGHKLIPRWCYICFG